MAGNKNYLAWDESSAGMKADIFTFDAVPNSPTGLTSVNFDKASTNVFAWVFGDPDSGDLQSAFQIQIIATSDGLVKFDSGKILSAAASYTLAEMY